ncbi:DUF3231 family protein [Oceanobacillus luteolus]|uniref:DUF3231 family protein n=1 Tax=Oceanobacillus luteolus TaxID=1274358 RepID=A0ABW4HUQ1_9BACI|nr:DUF3231 family protein [Oceanobacillus luteolus]MCM3739332.1 DUF3231 family protein [Oceanobacillus luteolus]
MVKNKQEDPFHTGEVYHLWNYLYRTKNLLVTMQVLINHAGDNDLKTYAEELVESCLIQEEQAVEGILKEAGIRLPPAPPDRPNVEVEDIPAGARFHDPEIATIIQKELMSTRAESSYVTGIALREDLRTMFGEFHDQQEEYEQKLVNIAKEKGWLVLPPINIK